MGELLNAKLHETARELALQARKLEELVGEQSRLIQELHEAEVKVSLGWSALRELRARLCAEAETLTEAPEQST